MILAHPADPSQNRIRILNLRRTALGEWAMGRMGDGANGRNGEWACGRVGVWACGRVGETARVDVVDVVDAGDLVDAVDLVDALLVGGCPSTGAVSPGRRITSPSR